MNKDYEELTIAEHYIQLAKYKMYIDGCYTNDKKYRWRISNDIVEALTKDLVIYKESYEKTLFGIPVDICLGEGILELYVETSDYQRGLENEKLKKAFDKLCKEIVNLKEAADCYEYEQCPFRKECNKTCNAYCYHVKAWADWAMKED